ncbi:MAG TPA: AraC family transcriptional regulator [Burkholderiales bacterium]|nr:AraC family transcriptional regulator [Burkholderiales bacterium]
MPARPELDDTALMEHDTLSDVLRTVRLRSAFFFHVACTGKWAAEAPPSREIARAIMPGTEHVMEYHVVTHGECWAAIVGEPPLRLATGDLVMLPHGDAHVVSSAPGMRAPMPPEALEMLKSAPRPFRMTYGAPSGKPATTLVCGFIGCDLRPFNPLIATLPRLLHLPASGGSTISEQFMRLAVQETAAARPGSEALLERMSEMMFVDAVCRHVEMLPKESTGWLAGLRDRHVGRALALLHESPAKDWTLEELGSQAGLSRSALHERFVALVGQPPMQYLAQWRMQLASRLLRESQASVVSVALAVGYESEAAFSRAFKRLVGESPSVWRRATAQA